MGVRRTILLASSPYVERQTHEIIGDMEAGANAVIDRNELFVPFVLFDEQVVKESKKLFRKTCMKTKGQVTLRTLKTRGVSSVG